LEPLPICSHFLPYAYFITGALICIDEATPSSYPPAADPSSMGAWIIEAHEPFLMRRDGLKRPILLSVHASHTRNTPDPCTTMRQNLYIPYD
jgi:hypothetical protein